MTKLSQAQKQFLELIKTGSKPSEAGVAVGFSKGIGWYWAEKDPVFASKFRDVWPSFGRNNPEKYQFDSAVRAKAPVLTVSQLAMQRLERELRTDGPNAVLAAAAIVLVSPYAAAEDLPAVETDEAPANALSFPEQPPVTQLSIDDLQEMFCEVFPVGELPAVPADTSKLREHIETYYNCSLPEVMNTSSRSIGNRLRFIAAASFPVAFASAGKSHMGKIYMVPQPKTRA
jgi:hypothetical protein